MNRMGAFLVLWLCATQAVAWPTFRQWNVWCNEDQVARKNSCTIVKKITSPLLTVKFSEGEKSPIIVLGPNDHPGAKAGVRMDENAPIYWQGVAVHGPQADIFLSQMLASEKMFFQYTQWPNKRDEDELYLADFKEAYAFTQAFIANGFKEPNQLPIEP